jgi:hypothetical protein
MMMVGLARCKKEEKPRDNVHVDPPLKESDITIPDKYEAAVDRCAELAKNIQGLIDKDQLPHKIWADCIDCIKFPNCDETAVILDL